MCGLTRSQIHRCVVGEVLGTAGKQIVWLSNMARKGARCRLTGAWLMSMYQLYLPREVTCRCYVLCSLSNLNFEVT